MLSLNFFPITIHNLASTPDSRYCYSIMAAYPHSNLIILSLKEAGFLTLFTLSRKIDREQKIGYWDFFLSFSQSCIDISMIRWNESYANLVRTSFPNMHHTISNFTINFIFKFHFLANHRANKVMEYFMYIDPMWYQIREEKGDKNYPGSSVNLLLLTNMAH